MHRRILNECFWGRIRHHGYSTIQQIPLVKMGSKIILGISNTRIKRTPKGRDVFSPGRAQHLLVPQKIHFNVHQIAWKAGIYGLQKVGCRSQTTVIAWEGWLYCCLGWESGQKSNSEIIWSSLRFLCIFVVQYYTTCYIVLAGNSSGACVHHMSLNRLVSRNPIPTFRIEQKAYKERLWHKCG